MPKTKEQSVVDSVEYSVILECTIPRINVLLRINMTAVGYRVPFAEKEPLDITNALSLLVHATPIAARTPGTNSLTEFGNRS